MPAMDFFKYYGSCTCNNVHFVLATLCISHLQLCTFLSYNKQTFRHHITDQNYFNIHTWAYTFVKCTKFQRIRKVGNLDLGYPLFDKMKNISDAWNPPIDIVTKYGRLNYPYESLLYTAYNNLEICMAEMKIKDNDIFALITYEAIQDINTTIVGHYQYDSAYTPDENIKNRELTNFFIMSSLKKTKQVMDIYIKYHQI